VANSVTTRTITATLTNDRAGPVRDLDLLADSASKFWNVAWWTISRIWNATGDIPDEATLKSYLKTKHVWKDLNAQSCQEMFKLEAMKLHELLPSDDRTSLGLRFFDAAEEIIDIAWSMAVGADIEFQATTGPEPRGATVFNRYFTRLIQQAHTDEALAEEFYRVIGMETAPTALLQPRTVWRTLRPQPTLKSPQD
jgi:hypothetical protein